MNEVTTYWESGKTTKERDQWLDAEVLDILHDSTDRIGKGYYDARYNRRQPSFIKKHSTPFNPLVERGQLRYALDILGKFGDVSGQHNGIKVSQSINRLVKSGDLYKETKGGKVRVALVSDIGYKPYMAF